MRCPLCVPARARGRHHRPRHDGGQVHCHACGEFVCARHAEWDGDAAEWVCTRCLRQQRVGRWAELDRKAGADRPTPGGTQ